MVLSDEDKILIKKTYISWRDITQDSWEQNFWTKHRRQVALPRSSNMGSVDRRRHGMQRQTAKCPHGWKHWPGER